MLVKVVRRLDTGCRVLSALLVICGLVVGGSAGAVTCRVTVDGTSSGDGSDWGIQAMDMQTALGTSTCTEVWVKTGTYKPTADADRTINFNIRPDLKVYGGFAGEAPDPDDRNPASHPTILSGDIGVAGDNTDNSYNVIFMDGTQPDLPITADTVLDGFTIRDGYADGSSPQGNGGGLYCNGSGDPDHECSPTLANLVFSANYASAGGAMYNDGLDGNSSPSLSNVSFNGNSAYHGGAMCNIGNNGNSRPSLNSVTFTGNSATILGGAMYNNGGTNGNSSPSLNNVTFIANHADHDGGAMYNSGFKGNSSPSLTNVTFIANYSDYGDGGAMYNEGQNGTSSPVLTNVTFSGNTASGSGGAMYIWTDSTAANGTSSPILINVTFSGNSANFRGGAMNIHGGSTGGTSNPSLTNVTFSGNSAAVIGGAMFNNTSGGTVSANLTNVTFSGNNASDVGGAIGNAGTGSGSINLQLNNVILWNNSTSNSDPEIYNYQATSVLEDSVVEGGCPTDASCTNVISTDPALGPLKDNGGNTPTMLPGNGSSAIDAGNDSTCAATDQRGVTRPQGSHCDIGAVEVSPDFIFASGFDIVPI